MKSKYMNILSKGFEYVNHKTHLLGATEAYFLEPICLNTFTSLGEIKD